MAKYDFNNSRYARFFSDKENQRFLQSFIDRTDLFFTNYGWYKTQGRVAPPTPTDSKGVAAYTVKARKLEAAPLADMRAPLGDAMQEDKKGIEFYTGTIPDFTTKGTVETAAEREYKVRQYEEFGNDADIVAAWVDEVQSKMDQVDATMTWMTAQLMTTFSIDYTGIGQGIQAPILDIPKEKCDKRGAGSAAWCSMDAQGNLTVNASTKILSEMKKIEEEYRTKRGAYSGALVWQMTRNAFYDVFLQCDEVRELVKNYRHYHNLAFTEDMKVNEDDFAPAFAQYNGVSPIEIVVEKERNTTNSTDTFVKGWANNIAVLRPAGDAVEFERTEILDRRMIENYGAKGIESLFAVTNDGLGLLVNTTTDNGKFREWHTNLFFSAVPGLIEFPNHEVIDITKKG